LTAPWLLRRGQHVRVDLVLTLVPVRVAWLMEAAGDVLGFAVCLVMMRYGFKMSIDSAVLDSITIKNLVFPEWWLLWPLPVCFALLAAEFAFRFDRLIHSEPGRRVEATSVG
jgi:TRAP-type C4-dicarboxylate transport system permease small subunit